MKRTERQPPSATGIAIDLVAGATGELRYFSRWLAREEEQRHFKRLRDELHWRTEILRVYGREVRTPRQVAWYGDPEAAYKYSGRVHEPLPWHPLLSALRQRLEAEFATPVNSVLANLYRDGRDSMGWHSDDERQLGPDPTVFSITLGTPRFFDYRLRGRTASRERIEPAPGSLLVMAGRFQSCWQHQVPKQLRVNEPRINLTFRYIRH